MWTKETTPALSLETSRTLALLEAWKAGRKGTTIYDLLDRRDWKGLLDYELSYEPNDNVEELIHARQALAFISKNPALKSVVKKDLEAEAYEKFLASEESCRATNALFKSHLRGQHCWTPAFEQILYLAKWKVEKMLGEAPTFQELKPVLGPGACTRVKRQRASPAEKLVNLACSVDFVPYLGMFTSVNAHWLEHNYRATKGLGACNLGTDNELQALAGMGEDPSFSYELAEEFGRLTFVEKDAKSKRTIVIEPNVNQLHQLALGEKIENALKRNGIDISNQITNQCLARYGSLSGALATLDLSSASDSISTELVRFLVPEAWFSLLNGFRSSCVTYRGKTIQLEKFSSMGNGFTFPLETLIFYSLIWASCPAHSRSWLSAYGDDLVVPSEHAKECIFTLTAVGFTINTRKSHIDGPFRESCGADYFLGVNIRPFYLKKLLSPRVLFAAYNFFHDRMDTDMMDLILAEIPKELILWGPRNYGDGHLISDDWPSRPHRRKDGWGGWLFYTYTLEATTSDSPLPGDYLQVLYKQYSEGESRSSVSADLVPTSNRFQLLTSLKRAASDLLHIDVPTALSKKGALKKVFPTTTRSERLYRRIAVYVLTR